MKKTILFILVVLMAAGLAVMTACSTPSASTAPSESASSAESGMQEFRVGMECNYAPFNWTQTDDSNGAVKLDAGGYAGGYDVEIAKKIAEGLGRKLVIVKTEWEGLIPAATSGKIDAIIAGMSPKEDRKVSIDFTDNYYSSELVIVVKKDSPYAKATSLADFKGAKITGQISTFHYDVISQIEGVDKQTAMETFPAMIVALESGKIDGYVSEKPGALSAMESNSDLTFVEFEEGKGFVTSPEDVAIAVGLKKGQDELLQSINKILAGISEDERVEIMSAALKNQPVSE